MWSARARPYAASSTTNSATARWNRAPITPAGTPARTSSTTAASTGAGSITAGVRPSSTSKAYAVAATVTVAGQALQLDGRLGLVADHLADAGQRRDRVEQPAHAGRRHASEPGFELMRSIRRSSSGQARTGARSSSQARPAAHRCDSAIRYGPQHADVAAGQRHVLQLRQPLIALVVGEQHLAAPDRAVGAVTGSVEGEAEHLLRPVQPVLGHHRGDVRVVVLDRPDRPPAGVAPRPRGGAVARVRVGDDDFRADAGQRLAGAARQSRTPTAWPGRPCRRCAGSARRTCRSATARVFFRSPPTASVGGTGTGKRDRQRRIAAGAPDRQLRHRRRPRTTESSHGTRIGPVVHQPAVGEVRKPVQRIVVGEADRLAAEVAGRHHQHGRPRLVAGSPNSSACSGV